MELKEFQFPLNYLLVWETEKQTESCHLLAHSPYTNSGWHRRAGAKNKEQGLGPQLCDLSGKSLATWTTKGGSWNRFWINYCGTWIILIPRLKDSLPPKYFLSYCYLRSWVNRKIQRKVSKIHFVLLERIWGGREREKSSLLIYSPNGGNSWNWAHLKPGTRSFLKIFHIDARPAYTAFPGQY